MELPIFIMTTFFALRLFSGKFCISFCLDILKQVLCGVSFVSICLQQISKHSQIEIGPVRLRDLGLDWLEKTQKRLAIGEPEKGSPQARLTT